MALKKYKGAVIQPPLDWYARIAQSATQWFTTPNASYWSFTLQNNANDGSSLWIYDAAVASGVQFPSGTGNPSGNPNPPTGGAGGSGTLSTWAFVSQTNVGTNVGVVTQTVAKPANVVAGNLLVAVELCGNADPSVNSPPDSSWQVVTSVVGNATTSGLRVSVKIATASEPASYTWTGPGTIIDLNILNFSGNANPGVIEGGTASFTLNSSGDQPTPSIFTTGPADMILCVATAPNSAGSAIGIPGFTQLGAIKINPWQWAVSYKFNAAPGVQGPFLFHFTQPFATSIALVSLKIGFTGIAPGQNLSQPIQTQSPVAPGLLTMQFESAPVGLSGVTKFLPPACDYRWSRDAPIAIIGPGLNFNLAGISPENAAWCDLTWLALRP